MSFLAVIDPPWNSDRGAGKCKRGADRHYELATVRGNGSAYKGEHWRSDGPGLLWMWATTLALCGGHAHALADGLGFRVCAGFIWVKADPAIADTPSGGLHLEGKGGPLWSPPARKGLGQWQRTEHEHLLVCRRGALKVPPPVSRHRSVVYAQRRKHSQKPLAAWTIIEDVSCAVMPGVRGIEWNARTRRSGWSAVGRLDGEDKPIRYEQGED